MTHAACIVDTATWGAVIGMGALLSVFLISIIYMLSQLVRLPTINAWARIEFSQALATMLLLGMSVLVINTACHIDMSFFGSYLTGTPLPVGPGNTYIEVAGAYLDGVKHFSYDSFSAIRTTVGAWERNATASQYKCFITCLVFTQGYSIDPFVGKYAWLGAGYMGMNAALVATLTALFQQYMLEYSVAGALLFLLPIGAFFRSLPYMRPFGGALMALALVLYVFFPLMLALNALFAYNFMQNGANALLAPGIATTAQIGALAAIVSFAGIFLPALNFIVLVAIARELSVLFGSELDISRLAQMI